MHPRAGMILSVLLVMGVAACSNDAAESASVGPSASADAARSNAASAITTDGSAWTDAGTIGVDYQGAAAMGDQIVAFTSDFTSDEGWQVHRGTMER